MPRKGPAPKRPVVADPVYGAPIVSQLVNKILLDGKKGVCEILGLDPLYLANEGTLVLFVPPEQAEAALAAMRQTPAGRGACIIGHATATHPRTVVMKTIFGGGRIVDMLVGEQLPRIC